jgi:hypothetical protein
MFDPFHISCFEKSDIKYWEPVNATRPRTRDPIFAILTIQGNEHAVMLRENVSNTADQIVADRLKFMCEIEPMYTVALKLKCIYMYSPSEGSILLDSPPTDYYMTRALTRIVDLDDEELLADEDDQIPYEGYQLNDEQKLTFLRTTAWIDHPLDLRTTPEFAFELLKILIFHWLIGVNTDQHHIAIHNGLPFSINELALENGKPSRLFFERIQYELDADEPGYTISMLPEVIQEVGGHFDFDTMRGILIQSREPQTDLKHRIPVMKLSENCRTIAENVEERLDFMLSYSIEEFVTRFLE